VGQVGLRAPHAALARAHLPPPRRCFTPRKKRNACRRSKSGYRENASVRLAQQRPRRSGSGSGCRRSARPPGNAHSKNDDDKRQSERKGKSFLRKSASKRSWTHSARCRRWWSWLAPARARGRSAHARLHTGSRVAQVRARRWMPRAHGRHRITPMPREASHGAVVPTRRGPAADPHELGQTEDLLGHRQDALARRL
jgi:hypothetical protein